MPSKYSAEELALLRTVAASPEDDAPRLVYADWLMERGEAVRGELISLSCELESLRRGEQFEQLLSKCKQLQDQVGPPLERKGLSWAFDRGLPTSLSCESVDTLLDLGEELFEAAPLLEDVSLLQHVEDAEPIRRLLHAGWFGRLKGVGWLDIWRAAALEAFDDPAMRTIEAFHVHPSMMDSVPAYERLGRISHLEGLLTLSLGTHSVKDASLLALLAGHGFPSLENLILANNSIGARGCQAIVEKLPGLRFLQLSGNDALGEGAALLAQLQNLETLCVTSRMPEEGCRKLSLLPRLKRLSLRVCGLTDSSALALLPLADRLEALDVDQNLLSEAAQKALTQAFGDRVHLPEPRPPSPPPRDDIEFVND